MASSENVTYVNVCSSTGVDCGIQTSSNSTMLILGFRGLTPTNIFISETAHSAKMPFQKIGDTEIVKYEGQFLPLLPPMDDGRGGNYPFCPQGRRPFSLVRVSYYLPNFLNSTNLTAFVFMGSDGMEKIIGRGLSQAQK